MLPVRGQTTVVWANSSGGAWETGANWSPANEPINTSYNVSISNAFSGAYTVTLNTSETVASLALSTANATLDVNGSTTTLTLGPSNPSIAITAGTLEATGGATIDLGGSFTTANLGGTINASGGKISITGDLNNTGAALSAPNGGGIFTLSNGMISGGTVNGGALTFGNPGGTLNGVTMSGSFNFPATGGASFTAENGTTFSGGTTTFTTSGSDYVYLNGTSVALSIASGATWTGAFTVYGASTGVAFSNQGALNFTAGTSGIYGGGYGLTFTNAGTITSSAGTLSLGNSSSDTVTNSSGGVITANGGTINLGNGSSSWHNAGTLNATSGGTINLGGSFATSDIGAVNATGGTVNLTGSLNNASATLSAPSGGGIFCLYGGNISGGTVSSQAINFTNGGGTLNDVAMAGNFTLPTSYATFSAENGTTFSGGTTTFPVANVDHVNLAGSGTALNLATDAVWTGSFDIYANGAGLTFTNAGALNYTSGTNYFDGQGYGSFSINNSGAITANTGATVYVGFYGGDTLTNTSAGAITANGGTVYLGGYSNVANWHNQGALLAENNGVINFDGSFATADLGGTINSNTGGVLNLAGALNNASATLNPPATGVYVLDGGTITGGTVASGAITFGNVAGYLNGVAMNGNFTGSASTYSVFYAGNGTTFGGGTMTFPSGEYGQVYLYGTGTALTIASGATWSGNFSILSQAVNLSFANQGTLNFTSGSSDIYGYSYPLNVTNSGSITAGSGATLTLGNAVSDLVTNASGGTITANGGTVNLGSYGGGWQNLGTLVATNNGVINFGGVYTTADLGGTIESSSGGALRLQGTFNNTGTLVAPASGIYTLAGAVVTGGTINGGALTFGNQGGTLNGVTMSGNFSTPAAADSFFNVEGNTTFTGGTTSFQNNSYYNSVYLNETGTALTIAPSETWTGAFDISGTASNVTLANEGALNFTSGSSSINGDGYGLSLVNSGTIAANGGTVSLGYYSGDTVTNTSTGSITANGGTVNLGNSLSTWQNLGSILATNSGIINFGGTYTTADLGGTIDSNTGGVLNLEGTLNNASATLNPPHTGVYTLYGGTIVGGTVSSGAIGFSNYAGILNGVTMSGNFSGNASGYSEFNAENNTTFTGGTTTLGSSNYYGSIGLSGTGTALTIASSATLTGNFDIYGEAANLTMVNQGTLNFTGGSNAIYGDGYGLTFTNNGTLEVSGGSLSLGYYYSGDQFTNTSTGTLWANGGTIYLGYSNTGLWTNAGTIVASNGGTVEFGGAYSTANLDSGTIEGAGGTLELEGTLNNAGATLNPPASGIYTLAGAVVNGGTVGGGALTFSSSGGTLNGVTMSGNFSAPSNSYSYFYPENNTTFTGGTTTFGSSSYESYVYLSGTGTALTIAPSATWTGNFQIYGDASNLSLVNQGALNYTGGSNTIDGEDYGLSFTNSGTITVPSGYLYLGYYSNDVFTNAAGGTVTASGGTVSLGGYSNQTTWHNLGTLVANNGGAILLGGSFANSDLGTIEGAGGTLDLMGILDNAGATLNPPTSGIYTLHEGTISGGTVSSGAITFDDYGGTLNGVTMTGNFTVPTYAYFEVENGTTFTGGTTTFSSTGDNEVELGGSGTALTIAPTATWTGNFTIYSLSSGASVVNQGTLSFGSGYNEIEGYYDGSATITNSGSIVNNGGDLYLGYYSGDSFTNLTGGLVEANGGIVYLGYYQAAVSNLSGGTLSGGTWEATGGGILSFEGTTPINTIGSGTTVILDGTGSVIRTDSGTGPSYQTLEQTLTTVDGELEVRGGRSFTSTTSGITNNGTLRLGGGATFTAASLTNDPGSALIGQGTFDATGGVTIGNGVLLSPGHAAPNRYVGTLDFGSGLTLGSGGSMTFDVMNASPAVAGTDYGTIAVTGTLAITATSSDPFTISAESIDPSSGQPGLANFNMAQSYQWTLATAGNIVGFNPLDFTFSTSLFANGLGGGSFSVSSDATDIYLNFTPVPEPSTWALLASGGALTAVLSLRRRRAGPTGVSPS
ncbi:MAG: PEP-CTERM sorting domain-containing protein [Opitutaceae bacterium]